MSYFDESWRIRCHKLKIKLVYEEKVICNWIRRLKEKFHDIETKFFFFDAVAPIWALAYLHETLRFTSVF
jgi:hypothetical protein